MGALWITSIDGCHELDGSLISAYYHPTKNHTASTKGTLGTRTSVAKSGEWALSMQPRALFGNKAYYSGENFDHNQANLNN